MGLTAYSDMIYSRPDMEKLEQCLDDALDGLDLLVIRLDGTGHGVEVDDGDASFGHDNAPFMGLVDGVR